MQGVCCIETMASCMPRHAAALNDRKNDGIFFCGSKAFLCCMVWLGSLWHLQHLYHMYHLQHL